jgi:hypothetical protein
MWKNSILTMQISLEKAAMYMAMSALVILLGQWYTKREREGTESDATIYREIIDRHMLNAGTDLGGKIPIWVPVTRTPNARSWPSFGSRMTTAVNKPYISLCIETLVKNAGDGYQVVVIDDTSYARLIPGWEVDLERTAEPACSNIRTLAQWKLLYYYGGVLVPASTICLKPMQELVDAAGGKCFTVETPATAYSDNLFEANPKLLGCQRESPAMQQAISDLEATVSADSTGAVAFDGDIPAVLANAAARNDMVVLDGTIVGTKTDAGEPVTVDMLFDNQSTPSGSWGLVLPESDISNRIRYGWFDRLSSRQVLESSVPLSVVFHWALGR